MASKRGKALNERHELFVREYLKDLNATQAYKRVYERNGREIRDNIARAAAARLLANVSVSDAVAAGAKKQQEEVEVHSSGILKELMRVAFSDVRKLFNEQGQLLLIHELPEEVSAAVSSIDVVTTRIPGGEPSDVEHTVRIKFWNKNDALNTLAKHKKLLTDVLEHRGVVKVKRIKLAGPDEANAF